MIDSPPLEVRITRLAAMYERFSELPADLADDDTKLMWRFAANDIRSVLKGWTPPEKPNASSTD